jgi:hypothetical protein
LRSNDGRHVKLLMSRSGTWLAESPHNE